MAKYDLEYKAVQSFFLSMDKLLTPDWSLQSTNQLNPLFLLEGFGPNGGLLQSYFIFPILLQRVAAQYSGSLGKKRVQFPDHPIRPTSKIGLALAWRVTSLALELGKSILPNGLAGSHDRSQPI